MHFKHGEKCHDHKSRESLVYVVCSEDAETVELSFLGETSHCVYEFKLLSQRGFSSLVRLSLLTLTCRCLSNACYKLSPSTSGLHNELENNG